MDAECEEPLMKTAVVLNEGECTMPELPVPLPIFVRLRNATEMMEIIMEGAATATTSTLDEDGSFPTIFEAAEEVIEEISVVESGASISIQEPLDEVVSGVELVASSGSEISLNTLSNDDSEVLSTLAGTSNGESTLVVMKAEEQKHKKKSSW